MMETVSSYNAIIQVRMQVVCIQHGNKQSPARPPWRTVEVEATSKGTETEGNEYIRVRGKGRNGIGQVY